MVGLLRRKVLETLHHRASCRIEKVDWSAAAERHIGEVGQKVLHGSITTDAYSIKDKETYNKTGTRK